MSGASTALETPFPYPSSDPAAAAAVTVLATSPASLPSTQLDLALSAVAPRLSDHDRAAWVTALTASLITNGITAPRRVAAFLGQCAAESAGFETLEEDLSYSAARLREVWPSQFPTVDGAEACALRPEALANRVYANRMGNGDEASGDGWLFRGRGLIQITGRSNYEQFARAMNMTLDQAVGHAATQAGAADSAAWYWTVNQLNLLADAWSIDLITRKINGGMAGAAERTRLCEVGLRAFGTALNRAENITETIHAAPPAEDEADRLMDQYNPTPADPA
jgi:putative chitinase